MSKRNPAKDLYLQHVSSQGGIDRFEVYSVDAGIFTLHKQLARAAVNTANDSITVTDVEGLRLVVLKPD